MLESGPYTNFAIEFSINLKLKVFLYFRERLESDLIYILDSIYPNGLNSKNNYHCPPLK